MNGEHHITYIRDSDRTRVIFVYEAINYSRKHALERAQHIAPSDFRLAAARHHTNGPLRIPSDGDDYGESGVPVYASQTTAPWST